jgi:hypothetical protein
MNTLSSKGWHSSDLAFTSYDHFLDLLETHLIVDSREAGDDPSKLVRRATGS